MTEPCMFTPPHEPFYCRIHADVRLRLTDERCRRGVTLTQPQPDAGLREALTAAADLIARFLWDGDTNDGGDDQLVEDAHDLIVRALACKRWRPTNLTDPSAAAENAEGCLDCGQAWWAHPETPDLRAALRSTPAAPHEHVWVTTFGTGPDWWEHCATCGPSVSRPVLAKEPTDD